MASAVPAGRTGSLLSRVLGRALRATNALGRGSPDGGGPAPRARTIIATLAAVGILLLALIVAAATLRLAEDRRATPQSSAVPAPAGASSLPDAAPSPAASMSAASPSAPSPPPGSEAAPRSRAAEPSPEAPVASRPVPRPEMAASAAPPGGVALALAVPPEHSAPVIPARPGSVAPDAEPALAIIIDDVGPDAAAFARLLRLPGPLTLSFLAYAPEVAAQAAQARAAGHEIFLHLGMQPEGTADPGPEALLAGQDAAALRQRTRWAILRVPGAVGMNNHMGSRLTTDLPAMTVVMDELGDHGLAFVDSRTTPRTVAEDAARARGLATTRRDIFLDNVPRTTAIEAELAAAETLARRRGTALAIGHPYPATIEALAHWLPEARKRGLRLVTARALIGLRSPPPATASAGP